MIAQRAGVACFQCSLDLQRSNTEVELHVDHWIWQNAQFPYPQGLKDRTVYVWNQHRFEAVSRYGTALIKLIPTEWGPPTFEIDGIKMLPSETISPFADAQRKVSLIQPRGKIILDCCAGLGYFAAWCLQGGAARILSFENSRDVLWLRSLNPWSPAANPTLSLTHADVGDAVEQIADSSIDAVLHDPPRFGIAGQLYSRAFYDQLNRVLKHRGRLFHYTGSPNKVSKGRDLAAEVIRRLGEAGFEAKREGDGVLATKRARPAYSVRT